MSCKGLDTDLLRFSANPGESKAPRVQFKWKDDVLWGFATNSTLPNYKNNLLQSLPSRDMLETQSVPLAIWLSELRASSDVSFFTDEGSQTTRL